MVEALKVLKAISGLKMQVTNFFKKLKLMENLRQTRERMKNKLTMGKKKKSRNRK